MGRKGIFFMKNDNIKRPYRVLIFSMTCGQGHNMIAKSLKESFEDFDATVKIEQFYDSSKKIKRANNQYFFVCKHFPNLYDKIWNRLRKKNHYKKNKLPFFARNALKHFKNVIEEFKPDIIVCTHLYASAVISYMKTNEILSKGIITSTILFDFTLAPYWEYSKNVDYIFQPFENTTRDLKNKGFSDNQIITLGMPVRKEFCLAYDTNQYKDKLNLTSKFTIMLQAGGGGIGKNEELVKKLYYNLKDINIICVNGSNKKSFANIEKFISKTEAKNIYNLGFVNNLYDYMKASDLILTKGGGNGISEILALKKPFVIRENMIINEKINCEFLVKEGVALTAKNIDGIIKLCQELKDDNSKLDSLLENISKFSKPNASNDIALFLLHKYNEK